MGKLWLRLVPVIAAVSSHAAWAHDGHGSNGAHWHATDTWGLVALALACAGAWWCAGRK